MEGNKDTASTVKIESIEAENNRETKKGSVTVNDVRSMLKLTKDGNVKQTIANCRIILENDSMFKGAIRKNELSGRTDIVKETNWKRSTIAFDDTDFNYILLHMEENYNIFSEKNAKRAIIIVANDNSYHPIKEKLNSLKWDGIERIGKLLPRYLGAEECEYTYEATRIMLMGAISRVFNPGCQFEYMVCFVGGQGVGKSSFL